jgi:hypothetical protein
VSNTKNANELERYKDVWQQLTTILCHILFSERVESNCQRQFFALNTNQIFEKFLLSLSSSLKIKFVSLFDCSKVKVF